MIKILIGYPPVESTGGTPTLGQNRQFQWFSNPCLIFPVVMAGAATMLKQKGYDVKWVDAVAEGLNKQQYFDIIKRYHPDLIAFETKTPVIRQHWALINEIKEILPDTKAVIMGDHVTYNPLETMEKSAVDYVLCGGDYDFSLSSLVDYIAGTLGFMPSGFFYRDSGRIESSGDFRLDHDLDKAPLIDRELAKWRLYDREYNLMGKPYFYIMSGRDCWWGKCRFCSWTLLYPGFRTRSVENVLDELEYLVERYGAREIFDDAGTLMTGEWLIRLCRGLIERGLNKKIYYSCNMRFGVLKQADFDLMKQAGFRLLKFGMESASQDTLDRLGKGFRVSEIEDGCRMARKAGLTVHLTIMVGYPWETKADAMNTFKLVKRLMKSGLADLLQATVLVPYPGTPLWREARKKGWFLFDHQAYERYDMNEPVLKTKDGNPEAVARICGRIYTIFLSPAYVLRRLSKIRSREALLFHLKGIRAVRGHLKDFLIKKAY